MELEVGLKITRTRDDFRSVSEVRVAKDSARPVFLCRETNSMFIITAYLTGYKRNKIYIRISEDGREISISGEKPVQEMVIMRRLTLKNQLEITGFKKVFKIPDGVVLDRIKAKYDEEESMLKILMPKLVKGICGVEIEEVKGEEFDRGRSIEQSEAHNIGESSQKASRETEVQKMVESERVLEKEGGLSGNMLKEIEKPKFEIEHGYGESVRAEVGKEGFEARMNLEMEQNVEDHIPKNIGETSQEVSKKPVVQQSEESDTVVGKLKGEEFEKMIARDSGVMGEDIVGGTKQKEIAEPKFEAEDRDRERLEKEVSKEGFEAMETTPIEFPKQAPRAPLQLEEIDSSVERMKGGDYEKVLARENEVTGEDIVGETKQKEIEEPRFETGDRDKKRVKEEISKERFEETETKVREFPKHVPKALEESEVLKVAKMEETEKVKEAMAKAYSKEIADKVIEKEITARESSIKTNAGDGQTEQEKIVKGVLEVLGTKIAEFPKQIVETLAKKESEEIENSKEVPKTPLEESEVSKFAKIEETEKFKEAMAKACSKEIADKVIEKGITARESSIKTNTGDGQTEPEKTVKGVLEVLGTNIAEFSKHIVETMAKKESEIENSKEVPETPLEESEVSKVAKMEETEKFKEAMAKAYSKEIADKVIEKDTTSESNVTTNTGGGQTEPENIVKGVSEVLGTIIAEFPKKIEETMAKKESEEIENSKEEPKTPLEESEVSKVANMEETEDVKEAMGKIESQETEDFMENVEGEDSNKMNEEAYKVTEKEIASEAIQREIEESSFKTKVESGRNVPENIVKGAFEVSGTAEVEFSKQMVETVDEKGSKEIETTITMKEKEEGSKNEDFEKDKIGDKIQKESVEPKDSDQLGGRETVDKGEFDDMGTLRKENLKQVADFFLDGSTGLKVAKGEETKGDKEEIAETENAEDKVTGEKNGKIQVEPYGGFRKDITKERTQKETEEAKVGNKHRDQQFVHEESKGMFEARKTAKEELPMQTTESLDNKRDGPKYKKIEEMKEVKEEEAKRKSEETKVVADDGSTVKEKQITRTSQEVPQEEDPKALEKGTPERELQPAEDKTTSPKVVTTGIKEVEQGSAKDTLQKEELLNPKMQSKETRESDKKSVNEDILKPKRPKEIGNIHEGGKEREGSQESPKRDPQEDSINMKKNQEAKETKKLQPDFPLEEQPKKEEQVTGQDAIHGGQKVEEAVQDKIEEPENEIKDRDQQNVPKEVDKGEVGAIKSTTKEMPKEEYAANVVSKVRRLETKQDWEETLEREKCRTAQNVKDEKPRTKKEIQEFDIGKVDKVKQVAEPMQTTPEKEHPRKSKEVEREVEPLEAKVAYPEVEAKPENEIEGPHLKELPPPTLEMQSKEPTELENSSMKWKFRKTKKYIPEAREGEEYSHGIEGIKAPADTAYQATKPSEMHRPTLTQQSIVEEKGKSDRGIGKQKSKIDFQESNERTKVSEDKEMKTLQPHILADQCLEEKEKADGQEEAHGACEFQGTIQEGTGGPKILTVDRGQQHMLENFDKKRFETKEVAEEESLHRKYEAETLPCKSENPKIAKSEDTKLEIKLEVEIKGITPNFGGEKVNEFKLVAEMKTTLPKAATKEFKEVMPNSEIEKSQTEEPPPPTMEIQSKEPHELSKLSMELKIPKVKGVQQEKEGEKPFHALAGSEVSEAVSLKRAVDPPKPTATHSKATSTEFEKVEPKGEIDKPQRKEFPSPYVEMVNNEPYELSKPIIKQEAKVEIVPQLQEGKESNYSPGGTKASEVLANKVDKPSKLSSQPSNQQFEVKEKGKTDECGEDGHQESKKHQPELDFQESTRRKSEQEVEKIKSNQEVIGQIESHEGHEIEEEIEVEQRDEALDDNSQELEELKDIQMEASEEIKDNTKWSKKLRVPLVITGSASLLSLIVLFLRHRRVGKSAKQNLM